MDVMYVDREGGRLLVYYYSDGQRVIYGHWTAERAAQELDILAAKGWRIVRI